MSEEQRDDDAHFTVFCEVCNAAYNYKQGKSKTHKQLDWLFSRFNRRN